MTYNYYDEYDTKEDYYDPRPRHTSSSSDGTVIERSGSPSEITAEDLVRHGNFQTQPLLILILAGVFTNGRPSMWFQR